MGGLAGDGNRIIIYFSRLLCGIVKNDEMCFRAVVSAALTLHLSLRTQKPFPEPLFLFFSVCGGEGLIEAHKKLLGSGKAKRVALRH